MCFSWIGISDSEQPFMSSRGKRGTMTSAQKTRLAPKDFKLEKRLDAICKRMTIDTQKQNLRVAECKTDSI